jgi:hypothetical protein
MGKPTKQTAERRAAILRAAQARSVPEASASITAADVWECCNPEDVQASNRLVGSTIADTLENCAVVLAFLSDFHCRKPCSELSPQAEAGLCLVVDWVLDAVEKQASELEVNRG